VATLRGSLVAVRELSSAVVNISNMIANLSWSSALSREGRACGWRVSYNLNANIVHLDPMNR
jgi:hypothetical protein